MTSTRKENSHSATAASQAQSTPPTNVALAMVPFDTFPRPSMALLNAAGDVAPLSMPIFPPSFHSHQQHEKPSTRFGKSEAAREPEQAFTNADHCDMDGVHGSREG